MRRFNGRTLEDALHAVTLALGTDARIIKADTVRSGGIGGFFSQEHVELTVETDAEFTTPMPSSKRSRKSAKPSRTTAKKPAVAAAPRRFDVSTMPVVAEDPIVAAARLAAAPAPKGAPATPKSILDLVEDVNEQDRLMATTAITEPIAEPVAEVADDEIKLPILTSHPEVNDSDSFAAVLNRISEQVEMTEAVSAPITAEMLPTYTVELVDDLVEEPVVNNTMVSVREAMPTFETNHNGLVLDTRGALEVQRMIDPLRALGVPDSYLPRESGLGDIYNRLITSLQNLPRPAALPQGDGSVIAVAGWRKGAIATAHELSIRLGLDPMDIVVASAHTDPNATANDRMIRSASQADEMRRSWRWRDHPTIVAVDASLGTRDNTWAAAVIRSLAPNAAWGVVDATRKPDDVHDWSATLGGLDAFCLVGASSTRTPAAILDLGVPIALIDGQPATCERWANLLTARLAA